MTAPLLVDTTQFITSPTASGIQRTILALARYWPPGRPDAEVGVLLEGSDDYLIAPMSALLEIAEGVFRNGASSSRRGGGGAGGELDAFREAATAIVAAHAIPSLYEGYLLPEPTYMPGVLRAFETCIREMGQRCSVIVFDALPETNPELFAGPHPGVASRYFITLRHVESAAFISDRTRDVVEQRLRGTRVPNSITIQLGADNFGREANQAPARARFVAAGTIEPRKRFPVVLDAFEALWRDGHTYELEILGGRGWESDELFRRLCAMRRDDPRLSWREGVGDAEWRRALRGATGVIFPSDAEGYGLPPLEALALGVPVIVSSELPSLADLPDAGQIRLDDISASTLAGAVRELAQPERNTRFRTEIRDLPLPTWEVCVKKVANWLQASLDAPR